MTTFSLRIELGNTAMQTPEDVAGALDRALGGRLDPMGDWHSTAGRILDVNGNSVGTWTLEPSDLPAFVPDHPDCTVDCAEYGCAGPGGWTHADAKGQA